MSFQTRRSELIFQLISLLLAVVVVHATYVSWIRPAANAHLAQQQAELATNPDRVEERSLYVVLRDFEQEACLILMFWAIALMARKGQQVGRESRLLEEDLLGLPADMPIGKEDVRPLSKTLHNRVETARDYLLPRALLTAIERYAVTHSVQEVSTASRDVCESEAERLESELSTIRYIAWAIPSVGFIGTVRGIGDALGQAHQAVEGDITGVTQSLGVAFNSTFIALVISIVLMFFIHQLQHRQERFVLDAERYVDHRFVRRLKA